MPAKAIRSIRNPISQVVVLATGDDLDGTLDNTQAYDVTDSRVILLQKADTLGTAGIDVIEISHDRGVSWAADTSIVPCENNDFTGNIAAGGALNAAGVEPPANAAGLFRGGPYEGPTWMRCVRKTTDSAGTTWVTGSPDVFMVVIGGNHAGGAPTAIA